MGIKEKLRQRELTIGSWLMLGSAPVVEVMKHAGFEWLVIDLEHTAIDYEKTRELITTIQSCGMEALVRVSKNEEVVIKKVLDFGADGIIVPMIRNREEAQQAVSFSKYPPDGTRGVGLFRAQDYGLGFEKYKKWVKDGLTIIAQIEHIDGVDNIDDILDVSGIDGVIIGPYDMSASMGYPGDFYREDVQSAVSRVFETCVSKEKSVGFHVVETDHEVVAKRIAQGCNLIAYSIDYFFLRDKAIDCVSSLRAVVEEK